MASPKKVIQEEMKQNLEKAHELIIECYDILQIMPEAELPSAQMRVEEASSALKIENDRLLGLLKSIRKKQAIKSILSAQRTCSKTCATMRSSE